MCKRFRCIIKHCVFKNKVKPCFFKSICYGDPKKLPDMHPKTVVKIWQYCFSNLGGYLFTCFELVKKKYKPSKARSPKKQKLSQRELAHIVATEHHLTVDASVSVASIAPLAAIAFDSPLCDRRTRAFHRLSLPRLHKKTAK